MPAVTDLKDGHRAVLGNVRRVISLLASFIVFYVIVVIFLFAILDLSGWETAAAGLLALVGPVALSQLLYRWKMS